MTLSAKRVKECIENLIQIILVRIDCSGSIDDHGDFRFGAGADLRLGSLWRF